MLSRMFKPIAIAGLIGGAIAVPAAQASDAGLRKVVKRQEAKVTPLAKAFVEADQALGTQTKDTVAAAAATAALRVGFRGFRKAVEPVKTQSTAAKKGKKQLLTAIVDYDLALVEHQALLDKLNSGATKESLNESFVTLNRRLRKAVSAESSALKLLKLES